MYLFIVATFLSHAFSYEDTPIPGVTNGVTRLQVTGLNLNKKAENGILYQSYRGGDEIDLDYETEVLGHEFYPVRSACNVIYQFNWNSQILLGKLSEYEVASVEQLTSQVQRHLSEAVLDVVIKNSSHIPVLKGSTVDLKFTYAKAHLELSPISSGVYGANAKVLLDEEVGKLSLWCTLGLVSTLIAPNGITLEDMISDIGDNRIKSLP